MVRRGSGFKKQPNELHQKNLENLHKVNPFEHIRKMQLNKIRIKNATKWDVVDYDDKLVAKA